MVQESLKAAEELEKDGYSVEVIDLRTVQPIDIDTLVASVEKTGRAVVVQAQRQAGVVHKVAAISRASNSFIRSSNSSSSRIRYNLSIYSS